MIPKIIHYCWFGKGRKPALLKKCIKSWKKYLPDYQILEWNEDNFDIARYQYAKEAYECKQYAFVADVARLFALKEYGGIYFDIDIEIIRPLDSFLSYPAFLGFESAKSIQTGLIGSEKGGDFINMFLSYYEGRHFFKIDSSLDKTTNAKIITDILVSKGLVQDNTFQNLGIVVVFPKEYFCPMTYNTCEIVLTENSCAIHHFNGSWMPNWTRITRKWHSTLGDKTYRRIVEFKNRLTRKG